PRPTHGAPRGTVRARWGSAATSVEFCPITAPNSEERSGSGTPAGLGRAARGAGRVVTLTGGGQVAKIASLSSGACPQSPEESVAVYAVFRTGGKQYRARQGERVRVERLEAAVGDAVKFD